MIRLLIGEDDIYYSPFDLSTWFDGLRDVFKCRSEITDNQTFPPIWMHQKIRMRNCYSNGSLKNWLTSQEEYRLILKKENNLILAKEHY